MSFLRIIFVSGFLLKWISPTVQPQSDEPCGKLNHIFATSSTDNKMVPCRCFLDHPYSSNFNESDEQNAIWIGCSGQSMPSVFRALNALNETVEASRLVIWNSLVNILPEGMFRKIMPETLSIEHSALSVFRNGSLRHIGERIRNLKLSHNILRSLDARIFKDLPTLEKLDISYNKLDKLVPDNFVALRSLQNLILSGNHLNAIESGTFKGLEELRVLDLSRNQITNISSGAFRGLKNLRELYLQQNELSFIDWAEIAELKHLEVLDLSMNSFYQVELIGLPKLKRLSIDNNSITDTNDLILRDLPALEVLSIDNNAIGVVRHGFLRPSHFASLRSLSLADNGITSIERGALYSLPSLTTLSLQKNYLMSFANLTRSEEQTPKHPPLPGLKHLYLSANRILTLDEGLNTLKSLELLSLDNNEINETHPKAFEGLTMLKKLFLNGNNLTYLPEAVFKDLNDSLTAIDLTNNSWNCTCDQEWLAIWLRSINDVHVHIASDSLGCLQTLECTETKLLASWITHLAMLLAFFTVITLFCILCTMVLEWHQRAAMIIPKSAQNHQKVTFMDFLLRRVPSDMDELLPPNSTNKLVFPNPVTNPADVDEGQTQQNKKDPMDDGKQLKKCLAQPPFVWKREPNNNSTQQKKVTFTGI